MKAKAVCAVDMEQGSSEQGEKEGRVIIPPPPPPSSLRRMRNIIPPFSFPARNFAVKIRNGETALSGCVGPCSGPSRQAAGLLHLGKRFANFGPWPNKLNTFISPKNSQPFFNFFLFVFYMCESVGSSPPFLFTPRCRSRFRDCASCPNSSPFSREETVTASDSRSRRKRGGSSEMKV